MNPIAEQSEKIEQMLNELSTDAIAEVIDFVEFLREKERKRKAFAERVLKIERESDTVSYTSAEDAMKAIRDWDE
ncbi:MAG: DUF2281 domain-containing protein [Candidatus Anammoxibacter sp.]